MHSALSIEDRPNPESSVPSAPFWRRFLFPVAVAAFLAGCGSVYRVDSVFTSNTLPSNAKSNMGNDDFYQKDGKSYYINSNSDAFKDAFMEAHVKNTIAVLDVLQATQDAFRAAINALDDAQEAIESANAALNKAKATDNEAVQAVVKEALTAIKSVDTNPAKTDFEAARDAFTKDESDIQKFNGEHVKRAKSALDSALDAKQGNNNEATRTTLETAQNAYDAAQEAYAKAYQDKAKAARSALKSIQRERIKPAIGAFENVQGIFVTAAAKKTLQQSQDENIKQAKTALHKAMDAIAGSQAALDRAGSALDMVVQIQNKATVTAFNSIVDGLAKAKQQDATIKAVIEAFNKVAQSLEVIVAQNEIESVQKKLNTAMNTDVQTGQGMEEERARGARNSLISRIVLLADEICLQHKADIQGTAVNINLISGTATTLFSGAASLATGTGAQTLSAFAAASSSTRSLVSAEVYQQTLSASILLAIDSDRNARKTPIIDGMKSSTADYPIEMAIQQINEYHQSCSFVNGIEVISKAVQQRPKAKSQLQSEMDYLRGEITKNDNLKMDDTELKSRLGKLQTLYLDASQ